MKNVIDQELQTLDPEISEVLDLELQRQRNGLEMIASENFAPRAVLECQGSVLTNKYAEGYPGHRYYGGCEVVDISEQLAIDRAKAVFGAEFANVQPHSGASANQAVYYAFCQPGDSILGMEISAGGHLTHGATVNFSGQIYQAHGYSVDPQTGLLDMDQVRRIALEVRPKIILAGWSAYPRHIDFAAFRSIADEVGAYLWTDMAHFAGLAAAGLHPNPVPYSDVVSSTTHKTLGGPRSGFILAKAEYAKKINSAVFPGLQGGPLEHVIAGKAVCFKVAQSEYFKEKQARVLRGAKIIAERLLEADAYEAGIRLTTGGTEVHLILVDLRNSQLNGKEAENWFGEIGITINKNGVPFDPLPPTITSGIRLGTPALATRNFDDSAFQTVANIVADALIQPHQNVDQLRARVQKLCDEFPL
ncbi:MAG: serine hydroxymethyltransferase, partial [Bifidobacteriaceae bacterium]|nr:serine hydroxymethyltransferase [Bifidobacteriaceae bacterium]